MTVSIVPKKAMPARIFPFVARCGKERQNSPQRRREMVLVSRHAEYLKLYCFHILQTLHYYQFRALPQRLLCCRYHL